VVWTIVLLGAVLTIGFTFFFGMPSKRMHMVMTGGFTAGTMLVLILIVALDWPFRGEVQASPSMFHRVMENMAMLDSREL
jgi:phosphate/sulfate permease